MIERVCSLIKQSVPVRERGLLAASGKTVPSDGTDGYLPGCYFQHTDGSDNDVFYINEGSVTSCDFNALGDLSTVDYSSGGTTAITISGTYTVEGISITNASAHGIRVGAFAASGSVASAMVLDATNSTAVEIHGGLASDPGSGTMARPLRSRLIVNTAGNVEAETYGMQGQLVVKSSNLGHWHGGVLGTIECQTALSVYNTLAGVGALVGRVGGSTITVQSSCYLAGVIALASAASLSNSGTYAGLYVTKTSGATNFSHGAYIENSDLGIYIAGASTYAIDIQTSGVFRMGVQDTGVDLVTAYPYAMEVHCEANADIAAASSSAGIYSRFAIEAAQTTQLNHIAVFAKLRPKANLGDGNHVGVYALVESSAGVISGTSSTTTAAGIFALDMSTVNITTGHLNGIVIDSSVDTGGTMNATMSGLRIKKSGSHRAWPVGIAIEASATTTGITIGTCATAAINITGDQAIGILFDVDASATDGLKISIDSSMTLTDGIEISGAGTVTQGIRIAATACTTGIAISSGSLDDGIKISGTTPVDGVEVSSACSAAAFHVSAASAVGLLVAGDCTTAAVHISGDQVIGILFDVDESATDGLKMSVDTAKTLTDGIEISGAGTVTTGFNLSPTAGTTGINIGSGFATGIILQGGLTPNTTRTNHALVIGGRASELSISFAGGAGAEHYEPIQMNLDFAGTDPASTSTVNIWQGAITLDTDALSKVRLKWSDLLTTVSKNCTDVYIHQAEIALSGTTTISSQVAAVGLVVDGGSGTITCTTYSALSATCRGTGTPANAIVAHIISDAGCVVASGVQVQGANMVTAIRIGDVAQIALPTNAFAFPAIAVGGMVQGYTTEEAPTGKIRILVDGATRWLAYWD